MNSLIKFNEPLPSYYSATFFKKLFPQVKKGDANINFSEVDKAIEELESYDLEQRQHIKKLKQIKQLRIIGKGNIKTGNNFKLLVEKMNKIEQLNDKIYRQRNLIIKLENEIKNI